MGTSPVGIYPVPVGGGNGTGKKSLMSSARHQVAEFAFEDVQLAANTICNAICDAAYENGQSRNKGAKPWCKVQAKEYLTFE